jgi:hypothetical protein
MKWIHVPDKPLLSGKSVRYKEWNIVFMAIVERSFPSVFASKMIRDAMNKLNPTWWKFSKSRDEKVRSLI